MKTIPGVLLVAALALSGSAWSDAQEPGAAMDMVTSGTSQLLGGVYPKQLTLAKGKPATIEKAPEGAAMSYGVIDFAGGQYSVALNSPKSAPQQLYVDRNGNGDLTDDSPVAWKKLPVEQTGGRDVNTGDFTLPLSDAAKTPVSLKAYAVGDMEGMLIYFPDYARVGTVTLGGKTHKALLTDVTARGDFRPLPAPKNGEEQEDPQPQLLIDLNDSGDYDTEYEATAANEPFNIEGQTWELADMSADGAFRIVKSDKTAEPMRIAPNLSVGADALAFKAVDTDGKPVDFPAEYKGKVVMLDFWATWCGPCMQEVPNLVKVYNQYHAQGFEILGISFDKENNAALVKSTTAENGMTWRQVYEGKHWETTIGTQYGIHSIPAGFLVDGDTGKFIVGGDALRGEGLEPAIKAALAGKAKPAAQ